MFTLFWWSVHLIIFFFLLYNTILYNFLYYVKKNSWMQFWIIVWFLGIIALVVVPIIKSGAYLGLLFLIVMFGIIYFFSKGPRGLWNFFAGGPAGIWTPNLRVRSSAPYPIGPQVHKIIILLYRTIWNKFFIIFFPKWFECHWLFESKIKEKIWRS